MNEGDRVDHHLSRSVRVMVFDTRLAIPSESAIPICWVSFLVAIFDGNARFTEVLDSRG